MIAALYRRLRILGALSYEERLRVAQVAPWVLFFRLTLHRLPFRRVAWHALRDPRDRPAQDTRDTHRAHEIDAISRAVTTTSALLKGTTTCLVQALAVVSLLRHRGIDAELCVGVARDATRSTLDDPRPGETSSPPSGYPSIAAHAWVEVDGRVVHGATTTSYQRLPSLEVLLRRNPPSKADTP